MDGNNIFSHLETIELGKNFSLKEQKRTLKLIKFFSDDNFVTKNYIKDIFIHNNYLCNETIYNIIKKNPNIRVTIDFNYNLYKHVIERGSFDSKLLTGFYRNRKIIYVSTAKKESAY